MNSRAGQGGAYNLHGGRPEGRGTGRGFLGSQGGVRGREPGPYKNPIHYIYKVELFFQMCLRCSGDVPGKTARRTMPISCS